MSEARVSIVPKLQEALNTMEIYQLTYPEDTCIVVNNTEKIIGYLAGKQFDIGLKVGEPNTKFAGSVAMEALRLRPECCD